MSEMVERRQFSQALLDALEGAGFPAAIAERPHDGGWQGEPNVPGSVFQPYCVLVPMTATTSSGPFDDSQADWKLPYTLSTYALRSDQIELVADRARNALAPVLNTDIASGGASYRVIRVGLTSIGQVNRADQTDPSFYTQTDGIELWVTKELS